MPRLESSLIAGSVPNFPFFYFVFRAYSHYSALNGGKLLEHLLKSNLVEPTPSAELDTMYTTGLMHSTREKSREAPKPSEDNVRFFSGQVEQQSQEGLEEVMMLPKWNGKLLAEAFKLPEMEVEIERARSSKWKTRSRPVKKTRQTKAKYKGEHPRRSRSGKTGRADDAMLDDRLVLSRLYWPGGSGTVRRAMY